MVDQLLIIAAANILSYNFASPIILNTFAAIAEALAKAIPHPPTGGSYI
jgi:hypothetical protein